MYDAAQFQVNYHILFALSTLYESHYTEPKDPMVILSCAEMQIHYLIFIMYNSICGTNTDSIISQVVWDIATNAFDLKKKTVG